jgi:CRP-like cAMP-binding protein
MTTAVAKARERDRPMCSTPRPDARTIYSHQQREVDPLAWPVFSERVLAMLRSAGEVQHPEGGELLWDAGDPYHLTLVLAGGVLLVDRRDNRVVFVIEEGDFVGELGMLMGQRAFLPGVAMEGTELLKVQVARLRELLEISGELSDVLLSALDARRGLLTRIGEGGLVLACDDDRDLHRLQEFAERNQLPYRTVLRAEPSAWAELARTSALPDAGTAVVTGQRRVMKAPTTRELATALGIDLWGISDDARCDLLIVGAGPAGLAAHHESRTTSATTAACPAPSWRGPRHCRRSSSGHGSCHPARSPRCRRCPAGSVYASTRNTRSSPPPRSIASGVRLAQRLTHHERVAIHPRCELSEIHGPARLSAVTCHDHALDRDVRLDAAALFLMIGADPCTTWLQDVGVQLDASGFVVTHDDFATSVPGLFAVGDVRAGSVKRVASAVGEGSVAISAVHSYLAAMQST